MVSYYAVLRHFGGEHMFGYVKPESSELLVRELEFYKATYCGICRSMKKHTGFLSNVTLSYDSVFLALVRMLYLPDESFAADMKRCIAHPLKRRCMLRENAATEYTAKAFALLTYYKLKDDLHDEKLLLKIGKSFARPILSSAKRKAKMPNLSETVAEKLSAITKLEDEKCGSVDEPAELFGELLGAVFSDGLSDADKLVTYQCGYHLGRFIYAADAAEDYERDRKSGSYNPYVLAYGGEPLSPENKSVIKCALLLECRKLESAVNLMPFGKRATIENIIRNIIYLGLPKRISFLDGEADGKEKSEEEKN